MQAAAAAAAKPEYELAKVVRHIVHEIRQPLSTIESIAFYLEMVLPRTEGKARRQLVKLQDEVEQINWVLTDAIHFLQAAPPRLQTMDLSEVIARSIAEWRRSGSPRITLRLATGLPLVALDLEQVQHLLRNVLYFFGRLSDIEGGLGFETRSCSGGVVLEITSAAPPWSEQDLQALLEPFEEPMPAGSGLKLASVRRIAEAHGGRVELHSGANGVSLSVLFPAA
jgi:signal transduction histidine kinase